jgi:hypothetical protein
MLYVSSRKDLHTVSLERFQYGGTNITGFRLVNLDNSSVSKTMEEWQRKLDSEGINSQLCPADVLLASAPPGSSKRPVGSVRIKTEAALMYDAVHVFANALSKLGSSHVISTKSINCEGDNFWEHGDSLINFMKLVRPTCKLNVVSVIDEIR